MPNWMEGCLKVRGSYENVKRFFTEGLNIYRYKGCDHEPIIVAKEEWMHVWEDAGAKFIIIDFLPKFSNCLAYVEGTKRTFISTADHSIVIFRFSEEDDAWIGTAVCKQAWGFRTEEWLKIAEQYSIDIRFWGIESGLMSGEEVEIVDGKIIKDDITKYDTWTIPLPWLGG